jgi:hypothetical protein
MLGRFRRKLSGKKNSLNRSLRWNVNTNYGIIFIIFNRKDSFKNLALSGIRAEKAECSVWTELQFSDFILTARTQLKE